MITKKKGCKFSSNKIKQLQKQGFVKKSMNHTLRSAEKELDKAYKEYWKAKKDSKQLRTTFIEALATSRAEKHGHDAANILRQMFTWEKQRHSARAIKNTLEQFHSGGVTKVAVKQPDDTTHEYTTKEAIEQACIDENQKKFSQTNDTPCMTRPLVSDIGYMGISDSCEKILANTYTCPPNSHPFAQEFFDQFKRAVPIHANLEPYISSKNYKRGWRKMKEQTTSGISGMHFGHMKSCAQDKFLCEVESAISNIPYSTGYTPHSWKRGVNVMIHKKNNSDLVTNLRTIVLTEADFNFNNKYLGKTTLYQAEKFNAIAKEQYGSRKGKSATRQYKFKILLG